MWFTACGQGNFGLNCTSPCHCLNGESCDHVSGNCPGDLCAPGWTTSNCSVGKNLQIFCWQKYATTKTVYLVLFSKKSMSYIINNKSCSMHFRLIQTSFNIGNKMLFHNTTGC